jgi:2-oxoglutarate ferredoxin oxidoreductase subunit alpha
VPIIAAATPGDCFHAAIEGARIAVTYRTPGFVLSDGYLANGAEPWRIPDVDDLPDLTSVVRVADGPNHDGEFWPFQRDPQTLARPWAVPGTPGLEHRIGGLEKADGTGSISYDPDNHQRMTELRAAKVARIAETIPALEVDHVDGARLLVLGWGSTYGPIRAAVRRARADGMAVAVAHLRHLNPFPANVGEVLHSYERVLVPEMNSGQLQRLLRAEHLVDVQGYHRVSGLPFTTAELVDAISHELKGMS